MKVILFGATGMIGQGVLRECLLDPGIVEVLAVGRSASGQTHPKLREIRHADLGNLAPVESQLTGYDACFFCVGLSSAGMTEADYRTITVTIPMAVAGTLARLNPHMTFILLSGGGADSTEQGRTMWARVKGEAENALRKLPFRRAHAFRPGLIQPMHGIRSRTGWYNAFYAVTRPLLPALRRLFPRYVTTTELNGRAMIAVARNGAPQFILENDDINRIGTR